MKRRILTQRVCTCRVLDARCYVHSPPTLGRNVVAALLLAMVAAGITSKLLGAW